MNHIKKSDIYRSDEENINVSVRKEGFLPLEIKYYGISRFKKNRYFLKLEKKKYPVKLKTAY